MSTRRLMVTSSSLPFHVDGADLGVAMLLQDADQMAADETTGTSNDYEIILRH
jgi:hypothetical protein